MQGLTRDQWYWDTPLTVPELRDRLAARAKDFSSTTSETGFQLTPVIWGQSSFLPRILGRWEPTPTGTRIEVVMVPNPAVQICLIILFAFLGILVYDQHLERVALLTGACALLAWLWLQSGRLTGAAAVEGKLQRLLEAVPTAESLPIRTSPPATVSLLAVLTIVVVGMILWRLIYNGVFALTTRPAVDLVYVYWGTQALAVGWLFWLSRFEPQTRMRWLTLLFLVEIGWTWCMVVDGYAGDGRPILAWRWSPMHATKFAAAASTGEAASGADVDLSQIGPHDFAEFRGRRRDGVVTGLALNPDWQQSPPQIEWQQAVSIGWSAFAVAGDFAITQEQRGEDEAVVCYELANGRPRWEHRDRALFHEMMGGDGPRATPTIHEGRVYALGATGILNCLDGRNGRPIWSVNVVTENSAPASLFGMTGSPLIWNELVIVAPGGRQASVVAYDRHTGRRMWHAGDAVAAYASPQLATFGGVEQILCFNAEGLFAHACADGRILWSIPWVTPPERNNVCQPVVWIDDAGRETVFISSGYGKGCGLFEVNARDGKFVVTPRWQNTKLQAKFTSVVERDGYVYGLDNTILCCLDLRTGRRCWKNGRYGFGQLLRVEHHLLVLTDEGELVMCDAIPDEHRELARFPVLNGRTWNHLALAGDRLLIRNDRLAACVKLPLMRP